MKSIILLTILTTGCAIQKTKSIIDERKENNISSNAILNLARTSYLRGCVDSKNYWFPEKNKAAFNRCSDMANEHSKDIEAIINSNLSEEELKKKIKQ